MAKRGRKLGFFPKGTTTERIQHLVTSGASVWKIAVAIERPEQYVYTTIARLQKQGRLPQRIAGIAPWQRVPDDVKARVLSLVSAGQSFGHTARVMGWGAARKGRVAGIVFRARQKEGQDGRH